MASTIEKINKDGNLPANEVIAAEVTRLISNMYVYKVMLPPERKNEAELIENWRNQLVEIRNAAETYLKSK